MTIDYDTWYNPWMKQLARNYTQAEFERKLNGNRARVKRESAAHLSAINATHSMGGQSQRRAQARNTVAATGDEAIALKGALEIYELFPEHTKEGATAKVEQ